MRRCGLLRGLGLSSTYSGTRAWLRPLGRLAAVALAFTLCASATAATGVLTWVAPTQNTDGSPLTDLAGYRAHYGCGSESGYPNTREFPASATSGAIEDLPDGAECRFVLVAVNAAGVQSAYSNEARKTFPGFPPADPVEIPAIEWRETTESPMAVIAAGVLLASGQGSQTIDLTSAQIGDVLLVATNYPSGGAAGAGGPANPTGWTELTDQANSPIAEVAAVLTLWVKQYTSTPPSSETFTNIRPDTSPRDITVEYVLMRGADASQIDFPAYVTSSGTQSSIDHPSTTVPGTAPGFVVLFEFQRFNGSTNLVAPPNFTIGGNEAPAGTANAGYVMYRADQPVGSTGTLTVNFDPLSSQRIAFTVSLAASSGGGAEEGDFTAGVGAASAFSAVASASGTVSAGIAANSAFSGRAAALGAVTEAIAAGDSDSAAQAALRAFTAQVSADAQYAAIAQAASAIQAGLEAGEVWAAIAAAEAGLIAGAELGATFAGDTESAQTAALEAGTEAAAQFLGAVAAFGLLEAGASAADAFAASARIGASISDAAQFGASFTTASLNDVAFSAATSLQSAFASEAAAIASLSAQASVQDAYTAVSVALAAINIGVVLDASFSAASSADVSIVGATASVRAIRRMSATVRAIRPTAKIN